MLRRQLVRYIIVVGILSLFALLAPARSRPWAKKALSFILAPLLASALTCGLYLSLSTHHFVSAHDTAACIACYFLFGWPGSLLATSWAKKEPPQN